MTDNFDVTPGTGATMAADLVGGIYIPRAKLVHGADGVNDGDVSRANPLPIIVGPPTSFATDSFSRPADTTAYAANDLVANNATAGSVVARTISVAPGANIGGYLERCLFKSNRITTPTNLIFRIHLFNTLPAFAGGDNAVFTSSVTGDGYLGSFTTQYPQLFSNCAIGAGAPTEGYRIHYTPVSGQDYLYWVPEALGTFTPNSGETFTLIIPK